MSDGPIPIIQLASLQFVPEPTDFTGILNDNLGQLGTDQDGFDQILNDTMTLAGEAGAILATFDSDLSAAAAVVPEFDTTAPADLAASLQTASDAADSVLNDFTQSVAPAPQQGTGKPPAATVGCPAGTVVNGLTTGQPDPNPYPPIPGVPFNFTYLANVMCTDNEPQKILVSQEYETYSGPLHYTSVLDTGDPTIFSIAVEDQDHGGGQLQRNIFVVITPSKAGRFQATVTSTGESNYQVKNGINATIVIAKDRTIR
jgi:hypothetical protein